VREASCTGVESACNDNYDTTTLQSYLHLRLSRGLYYVFVDGRTATDCGSYSLLVDY